MWSASGPSSQLLDRTKRVIAEAMAPGRLESPIPVMKHKPKEESTFVRGFYLPELLGS
jgi:hypothetical protein